jgi:hypothetical protein
MKSSISQVSLTEFDDNKSSKKRKAMDMESRTNVLFDLYGTTGETEGGQMRMARSVSAHAVREEQGSEQSSGGAKDSEANTSPAVRRCSSDGSFMESRQNPSGGFTNINYSRFSSHGRATTMLLQQRSNAQGVKDLVASIDKKVAALFSSGNEAAASNTAFPSKDPDKECKVLSQVAHDAYYRVVISSSNGIAVLIKAMNSFPQNAGLQESCCEALGNLCARNERNLFELQKEEGIKAIVTAMRMHPSSIAVQSAACEALHCLNVLILAHTSDPHKHSALLNDMIELLQRASAMYITPSSKYGAKQLLTTLTQRANVQARFAS